jgi:SET domain-containing protein
LLAGWRSYFSVLTFSFLTLARCCALPKILSPMIRNIVVRRSPIHGTGIFAARDLPAGKLLFHYQGRLMTHAQADRMYDGTLDTGHTFLFTLNERYILDANVGGNCSRFLNHSCAPNCEAMLIEDKKGDRKRDRIAISTMHAVAEGEELTYDYGITLEVRHTARLKRIWACRCGQPNCSGTILKPKKRKASVA